MCLSKFSTELTVLNNGVLVCEIFPTRRSYLKARREKRWWRRLLRRCLCWKNQSFTGATPIDSVRKFLSVLKPMNLVPLLCQFLKSGAGERAAILASIAELYGFFWVSLDAIADLVFQGLMLLLHYFPSLIPAFGTQQFVNQSLEVVEGGFVESAIEFLSSKLGFPEYFLKSLAKPIIIVVGFVVVLGSATGLLAAATSSNLGARLTKTFTSLGPIAKTWKEVVSGPSSLLSTVMTALGSVFGFTYEDEWTVQRRDLIDKIECKLELLKNINSDVRLHLPKLIANSRFIADLKKDLDSLDKLYVEIARKTDSMANCKSLLDRLRSEYDKLESVRDSLQASLCGKQLPTVVWIYGDSGVGKSMTAQLLIQELSQLEGRPLLSYTRSIASDFWNGYVGQDVVLYDDFGSARDDKDSKELVEIYTPSSFPLNMAALSEKRTAFCSRYVIICSNQQDINRSATLTDPSVIHRRRDFLFQARVRDAHIINAQQRVAAGNIAYNADATHLAFVRYQPVPTDNNRVMANDFGTVQDIARMMYQLQTTRNTEFLASLDRILQTFESQGKKKRKSDPNLFAELVQQFGNMFLFVGEPGIGKTTLAKSIPNAVVIDEFTSKWDQEHLEWLRLGDVDNGVPYIFTTNQSDLDTMRIRIPKDAWKAFARRCHHVFFSWQRKTIFSNYTMKDVQDAASWTKAVKLRAQWKGTEVWTLVSAQTIRDKCSDLSTLVTYSFTDVPKGIIDEPDAIVRLDLPFQQIAMGDVSTMDILGHCEFEKGRFSMKHVDVFRKLSVYFPTWDSPEGVDIVSAVCAFNNAQIPTDVETGPVVIHLADISLWLTQWNGQWLMGFHQQPVIKRVDGAFVNIKTNEKLTGARAIRFYTELSDLITFDYEGFSAQAMNSVAATVPKISQLWEMFDIVLLIIQIFGSGLSIWTRVNSVMKDKFVLEEESADRPVVGEKPRPAPKIQQEIKGSFKENPSWQPGDAWADAFEFVEEAGGDPGARLVESAVIKNVVEIIDPLGTFLCHGLVVGGHMVVTVNHVGQQIQVRHGNNVYVPEVKKTDVLRDLLLLELPKHAPMFPVITQHIPSKKELRFNKKAMCSLATMDRSGKLFRSQAIQLEHVATVPVKGETREGILYQQLAGVTHSANLGTVAGDCGGPIILHDAKTAKKLIAIHSAATPSVGLGAILYREFFLTGELEDQSTVVLKPLPYQGVVVTPPVPCTAPGWEGMVKVAKSGSLTKDVKTGKLVFNPLLNKNRSVTTQLWKLPFDDAPLSSAKVYLPSVLSHKDPRMKKEPDFSPYEAATVKWAHAQPEVDQDILDRVVQDVGTFLIQKLREKHKFLHVLTKKEALNGSTQLDSSGPLWRKSSPGYPFTHWPEFKGADKGAALYQGDDGLWRFRPSLGKKVETCVNQLIDACRGENVKPASVFVVSLKDELLPEAKILEGKTRAFAACPFDYTIAHRMYFHAFGAALVDISAEIPIKVGINAQSIDFGVLYAYLTRAGDKGFDGDFKNWDATVPKVFLEAVLKLVERAYRELDPNYAAEDCKIRSNLFNVLLEPLLMVYDDIVKAPGGVVSGQPHTAIDNSLVNCFYYYYAWLILTRNKKQWHNWDSFVHHVSFAVYGDDNLCGVSSEASELFNFVTFERVMRSLNLEMTPAEKGLKPSESNKPLMELQFLKRNFAVVNGKTVGQLQETSLRKMISYANFGTRRKAWEQMEIRFDNSTVANIILACLAECTLHSQTLFHTMVKYFSRKAAQCGFEMPHVDPYAVFFNSIYYKQRSYGLGLPIADGKSIPVSANFNCKNCEREPAFCTCFCPGCGFDKREKCFCKVMETCNKCTKPLTSCVCCPFCRENQCSCWENQGDGSGRSCIPWRCMYNNEEQDYEMVDPAEAEPHHINVSGEFNDIEDMEYTELEDGVLFYSGFTDAEIEAQDAEIQAYLEQQAMFTWWNPPEVVVSPPEPEIIIDEDSITYNYDPTPMDEDFPDDFVGDFYCNDCGRYVGYCECAALYAQAPPGTSIICLQCNDNCCTCWENQSAQAVPTSAEDGTLVGSDNIQSVVPEATTAVAPMGTAEVVAPAAAALNVIDPWFYEHFVHLVRLTWSTTQAPGTLLWSTPIAPEYAHQNLAYVSRMYNVWAGGLDYNIKVAGTGFHAGALAIVRLPPNINPSTLQNVSEYTYFDYCIIDPKHLDVVSKTVCDQRRQLYHYRDSVEGVDSIGGYLAIFVLLQLNTSSSGTNQIDIEVLNKASVDFFPAQMKPVVTNQNQFNFSALDAILSTDVATDCMQSLTYPYFEVSSKTDYSLAMTANANGQWNSFPAPEPTYFVAEAGFDYDYPCYSFKHNKVDGQVIEYQWVPLNVDGDLRRWYLFHGGKDPGIMIYATGADTFLFDTVLYDKAGTKDLFKTSFYTMSLKNVTSAVASFTASKPVDATPSLMTSANAYMYSIESVVDRMPVPVPGERFMVWKAHLAAQCLGTATCTKASYMLQPYALTLFLREKKIHNFGFDQALLFSLRDRKTQQTLFDCKLYYEGFLVCSAAASTLIAIRDVEFVFQSIVPRFYILKPPTSFLTEKQLEKWQKSLAHLQAQVAAL